MLHFGGDYNPEQWPPEVHADDDALMRRAGLTTATVGVFSWSQLEPAEGRYTFGWLDETLDRLHRNGIGVVLATPTASPPPWFSVAYPRALPVTATGVRLSHGSRDTYCAASPEYRAAARRVAGALADRYAQHPAVWLWHVHNEYGTLCWCDRTAEAFRRWLRDRYGDLDALNDAWYTAFWSQAYSAWEQVRPPGATQYLANPAHAVDFRRFWSDELLACYTEQRDAIRQRAPHARITTNHMLPAYQNLDLWRWSAQTDVVAVDHYPDAPGTDGDADTAFGADRARSLGGGRPWLLMEQATSTVRRGGRILARPPGQLLRTSLSHVARGADGIMFFQWRASRAGAETWHAAMVPHAGPDSRVYGEVVELGAALRRVGEVAGSTAAAETAIVWDADSWWALEHTETPSDDLRYLPAVRRAHRALWEAGVPVDFVPAGGARPRHRLVLAPALYLVTDEAAAAMAAHVAAGATLVVWYFSGIVDERCAVRLGGYPGAFTELLGVRVEQFHPLPAGETVALTTGTAHTWTEDLHVTTATAVHRYASGPLAGRPAVTRNRYGAGTAWYVSAGLDAATYAAVLAEARAGAGVAGAGRPGVEVLRRARDDRSWLFVLNHTAEPASVPATGHELLTDAPVPGSLTVPAGGAAVVREHHP